MLLCFSFVIVNKCQILFIIFNEGNRDVQWRINMRQDENYLCVAPGKTPKFRISIDEKCPLQARPSTLTGITIITMWRRF